MDPDEANVSSVGSVRRGALQSINLQTSQKRNQLLSSQPKTTSELYRWSSRSIQLPLKSVADKLEHILRPRPLTPTLLLFPVTFVPTLTQLSSCRALRRTQERMSSLISLQTPRSPQEHPRALSCPTHSATQREKTKCSLVYLPVGKVGWMTSAWVSNAPYITTLNFTSVPTAVEHQEQECIMPLGLFQFTHMPFGLKGLPAPLKELFMSY